MRHRLVYIGLPIALVGLAAIAWLRSHPDPWPTPSSYRTVIASQGPIIAQVRAEGVVTPISVVGVPARISGQVISVAVDVNSPVETGQVLARIEETPLKLRLAAAQADLAKAKAQRAVRAATLARLDASGHGEGEGSGPAISVAKARLDLADADISAKEAQLRQREFELAQAAITAPIDGIILQRSVEPGGSTDTRRPDQDLFKVGSDLRNVLVQAEVGEREIGQVRIAQEARISVPALPGRNLSGTVRTIAPEPQMTPNGAAYAVRIKVDNARKELLPGMTTHVEILGEHRAGALRVPNEALLWRPSSVLIDNRDPGPAEESTAADIDPAGPFGARGQGGPGRIMLDRFRNDLHLSEDQTKALDHIVGDLRSNLGDLRALDPTDRRDKLRALRQQLAARLEPMLTPEQAPIFASIKVLFIETGRDRPGGVSGRVFILDKKGMPRPVNLRLGISDGSQTEILAGNLPADALLIVGGGSSPNPPTIRPVRP